ncbi:MAG: hypothetical protein A4E30_00296 [Methanomassiliicoccales archaeon PtaB.Bin215]|nr:MAG: hypothetical protein A4E30_00296 [Methanomassiliicoccales archaeon PtaB.Bin215]
MSESDKAFRDEVSGYLKEKGVETKPMSVVISDEGVSINGKAPLPPEVVSAAIDVVKARKGKQIDLEGKPTPEVREGTETKRYNLFFTDSFKVKISESALEKLQERKEDEIMAWVQGHMRLRKPKKPVDGGTWDKDAEALYAKLRRAF